MEIALWLGGMERTPSQLTGPECIYLTEQHKASGNLINTIQAFPFFIYSNVY